MKSVSLLLGLAGAGLVSMAVAQTAGLAVSALPVYPDGDTSYNPRFPCVEPVAGGAAGKWLPVSMPFAYALAPFVSFPQGGKLTFALRDQPRRAVKEVVALSDGTNRLLVRIAPASEGRVLALVWDKAGTAPRVVPCGGATAAGWRNVAVTWTGTEARCSIDGKEAAILPLPVPFAPRSLTVTPDTADEVALDGEGRFRLGWETGYAATETPGATGAKTTARVFGFDTFVVSEQPDRRDSPAVQLLNGTAQERPVTLHFQVSGEVTNAKWEWDQQIAVAAGSVAWLPIAFPFPLGNDVYHLAITAKGLSDPFKETRHFLHVARRAEPAGQAKFALHDTDRDTFGSWPDALPVGINHIYMRWSRIQGPPWLKDDHGGFGLDPETPSEEWNWNPRVDWAVAQGLTPYLSVMSIPALPWMREREYTVPGGMEKTQWDKEGGFPNIALYRRFIHAMAERYKGKAAWYEVDNEPYYVNHSGKPPADYVQVVQALSEEVHAVDPQARVAANVDSGGHLPWTTEVFADGVAQWIQAISLHTYTTPRLPDEANLPATLASVREMMAKTGKPLALVNSETGVYTALREEVDRPIPPARLAELIKQGVPNLSVATGWPHYALDERTAGISMIRNAVDNFAAGSEFFTFFGWNPLWPPSDWWSKPRARTGDACFAAISATKDGTRTPSQFTLAIAVLTAQFEGVLTGTGHPIEQGGVTGGLFAKKNGGEVAVLWSGLGQRSVLVQTPDPEVEIVSLLGVSRIDKASGNGPYLHRLELDDSPIYLHSLRPGLALLPSPVIEAGQTGQEGSRLHGHFTLVNRADKTWSGTVALSDPQGWTVTPASPSFDLQPKGRTVIEFACDMPPGAKSGAHRLDAAMALPDGTPFTFPLMLSARPGGMALALPTGSTAAALESAGDELRIDRPEQVAVGRPPQLASLQEEIYWKGPAELSGTVRVGYTSDRLLVRVRVHDAMPRLPEPWPGVNGSTVELFFDFRPPTVRTARGPYEKGVYQVILKPALVSGGNVELWNASERSGTLAGLIASGERIDAQNYWVTLEIPWKAAGVDPKPGLSLGFDVAIDGPGLDPGTRKSQLVLYGSSTDSVDTSGFGLLTLSPVK